MTDKQIIDKCPISEKCKEFENCKIQNILQQLQAKEQECEELTSKCNQLKQTLAEIKEIAEKIEDECGYLGFSSCANEAKEQILQKISEVLE